MSYTPEQLTLTKKVGFLLGWLFFGIAFLLAAAESALGRGFVTSTNDLLLATMPGKWIALKAHYQSFLFDTVVLNLFVLPGWLLAGIPAGFLFWTCRPHRENVDPELYDSLTTYDRLADLAEEEGALNDDPTYKEFNIAEYDEDLHREDVATAKDYMKQWYPDFGEEDTPAPRPMTQEEKMLKARDELPIPFDKLR